MVEKTHSEEVKQALGICLTETKPVKRLGKRLGIFEME